MPDLVVVGTVGKAHGLRGEVMVRTLSDAPGRFDVGRTVVLGHREVTIASSRSHQGRLLLRFEGVSDRNGAESLRGVELFAPPADVTSEDVYYAHELVGMAVILEDGTWLGDVADVVEMAEAAGYDLLEVDRDGTRWLLPSPDDLVEVVDADGTDALLVIDPPEGLIPEGLLDGDDGDGERDVDGAEA